MLPLSKNPTALKGKNHGPGDCRTVQLNCLMPSFIPPAVYRHYRHLESIAELQAIGWISGPLPKMISVQAEGCSPIVKAFQEGKKESEFFEGAQTCRRHQGTESSR